MCLFLSLSHVNIPALVNYHLLNSVQCSEAIMVGSAYETEEGSSIEIGCDGDSLTVNGIKMVLKKDIVTTNGVIHLIDQILIPDSGSNSKRTATFERVIHNQTCDSQPVFASILSAKEGMELLGVSQSTFSGMVSDLGLAAAMRPKMEYTLLAPVNTAFNSEMPFLLNSVEYIQAHFELVTFSGLLRRIPGNGKDPAEENSGKPHVEVENHPE